MNYFMILSRRIIAKWNPIFAQLIPFTGKHFIISRREVCSTYIILYVNSKVWKLGIMPKDEPIRLIHSSFEKTD